MHKILEKLKYLNQVKDKNIQQQQDLVQNIFSSSSNVSIIRVSANIADFCHVHSANQNIQKTLGYEPYEIVNLNINQYIIPKVLGDIHDNIVREFLLTSREYKLNQQKFITPINKDGFLVPCNNILKVYPNLDQGVHFVSFIQERAPFYCYPYPKPSMSSDQINHYIQYKMENECMTVLGISQTVHEHFGFPAYLTNNFNPDAKNFTLDLVCPELGLKSVQRKLLEDNQFGVVIHLDTTIIPRMFLLDNHDVYMTKQYE